jgi:hypothetical protein
VRSRHKQHRRCSCRAFLRQSLIHEPSPSCFSDCSVRRLHKLACRYHAPLAVACISRLTPHCLAAEAHARSVRGEGEEEGPQLKQGQTQSVRCRSLANTARLSFPCASCLLSELLILAQVQVVPAPVKTAFSKPSKATPHPPHHPTVATAATPLTAFFLILWAAGLGFSAIEQWCLASEFSCWGNRGLCLLFFQTITKHTLSFQNKLFRT